MCCVKCDVLPQSQKSSSKSLEDQIEVCEVEGKKLLELNEETARELAKRTAAETARRDKVLNVGFEEVVMVAGSCCWLPARCIKPRVC